MARFGELGVGRGRKGASVGSVRICVEIRLGERDLKKQLVQEALQEILKAAVTEAVGAGGRGRTGGGRGTASATAGGGW